MYKARTGGILSIVSGSLGALMGLGWSALTIYMMQFMFRRPYGGFGTDPGEFLTVMAGVYSAIGVVLALIGALGIAGGIFAIKRRNFPLALAGAIAGSITFFPTGIAAVIFVSMAQPEFHAPPPAPPAMPVAPPPPEPPAPPPASGS